MLTHRHRYTAILATTQLHKPALTNSIILVKDGAHSNYLPIWYLHIRFSKCNSVQQDLYDAGIRYAARLQKSRYVKKLLALAYLSNLKPSVEGVSEASSAETQNKDFPSFKMQEVFKMQDEVEDNRKEAIAQLNAMLEPPLYEKNSLVYAGETKTRVSDWARSRWIVRRRETGEGKRMVS